MQVQRFKDLNLESLLSQYSDVDLGQCSVVQEYLQGGRREGNRREGGVCSDQQLFKAQKHFQVRIKYQESAVLSKFSLALSSLQHSATRGRQLVKMLKP